jgi:hypothetical protein
VITDPLMWVIGLFGAGAALRSKKEKEQPGADFGKDAEGIPHYGILTPQRLELYEGAMLETKSPQAFRDLADNFEKVGLKDEAKTLRARADSRAAGVDIHEKRRQIIAQCLDSGDPMVCEEGADICEKLGMTLAARELRSYAQGLRDKATLALTSAETAAAVAASQVAAGATAAASASALMPTPPLSGQLPEGMVLPLVPGATPSVGVWEDTEYDRAKGFEDAGAFERHSEK